MSEPEIRDAASVIVIRDRATEPRVLMGQRGDKAAFMPNKFVFPGGALDAADHRINLATPLSSLCMRRLAMACDGSLAEPLILAAIRELWEETGLMLASTGTAPAHLPNDWRDFFSAGQVPTGKGMQFVFRAITPPGRTRRFDARFFTVDADKVAGDLDDFSNASDELSHLQWIPIADARRFDLPFITEVVLAQITEDLANPEPPDWVPFFKNEEGRSHFIQL